MKTSLFKEIPQTQGIKYAGSKLKLLPSILQMARKVSPKTVFDGFSGTTRVSQAFAQIGCRVLANDCAVWSKVFAQCYLKNTQPPGFYREIIEHLNHLPLKNGWFTEHYGGLPSIRGSAKMDGFKKPWQIHNTRKLDAIRDEIDNLKLDEVEKSVLLTSLILALDAVDSTIGHYAAYLNQWSPRSFNNLELKVPRIFNSAENHEVFCEDIFKIIENVKADLAYFDPPYGSNNEKMPPSRVRYAAYYHLWTSVVLNDKPELFGKAKRRKDTSDTTASSIFEEFRKTETGNFLAVEAIEKLLEKTKAEHIVLSYSSSGKATAENLHEILRKSGEIIDFVKIDYKKNVMASMRWTNDWIRESDAPNQEFLFLIKK